jgi:hypothetical protein
MARQAQARILIGGRRDGFQGRVPGLLEEAFISIEIGQPLYLAGGFGGVTADIIRAIGLDGGEWLQPRADAAPPDARLPAALAELSALNKKQDPALLANGLSSDEARRLAATHRPSEIAALVSLGLGRRFAHSKR